MKINVSLDDDLLRRVDSYADENYLSRSGLISIALAQYLSADDLKKAIKDLSISMNAIARSGSVSDDDRRKLEEIVTVCKYLSGIEG